MTGYILLPAEIRESKLWEPERPRTKIEALIDLSILATQTETISERKLADRWKWSRIKVKNFITELENPGSDEEDTSHQKGQQKSQKKATLRLTDLALPEFTEAIKRPAEKPPKRPPEFAETDLEMTISKYLYKRIKQVNPGFMKPNFQGWCKDIDAILRIDQRDSAELREVIDWTYDNDFWKGVVLSPAKLRKQYDKLNTKRITEEASGGNLFHDPPH